MSGGDRLRVGNIRAVQDSGLNFQAQANQMEQRLEDLIKRINAMTWDSDSRPQYDEVQGRFNKAYLDIKAILNELGRAVDGVARRHIRAEGEIKKSWLA
jgi:uncharacterized protein YukE